jgi:hypothetical protein
MSAESAVTGSRAGVICDVLGSNGEWLAVVADSRRSIRVAFDAFTVGATLFGATLTASTSFLMFFLLSKDTHVTTLPYRLLLAVARPSGFYTTVLPAYPPYIFF